MTGALSFYRSSIGKKAVMAVTGIIGVGFVLGHMVGNLQVYLGPEALNSYAAFLKSTGELLWVARIILLAALIIHITAAVQLTIENRKARPERYAFKKTIQASVASRTLRWGGLVLLFFIVYHILHFTVGIAPGGPANFSKENVYNNLVYGFQNPVVSIFYIAAMAALTMHIYHGAWSMFQSLGLNNARWSRILRRVATGIAVALCVGNMSIPIAVLVGLLKPQM
jgi:succinate dehydrogenase / fumarate reductase cytochrome b subunit